ncbi:MAG: hypothetical protein DRN14_07925, partial [Thermoplasmata archaeon]
MKVDKLREVIAKRAQELWEEALLLDAPLHYSRVKAELEHIVEAWYAVPNMWEPSFVEDVSVEAVEWLMETASIVEVLEATRGSTESFSAF